MICHVHKQYVHKQYVQNNHVACRSHGLGMRTEVQVIGSSEEEEEDRMQQQDTNFAFIMPNVQLPSKPNGG